MNIKKTALLIVLLLCLAVAAGCQEGHARRSSASGRQVVLEPSVTGFWQARLVYADAN
ncbi:MAG: hypothetical protein ACYSWW_19345 [Planctomycetota bacterium]|jgi:hypothetical protein